MSNKIKREMFKKLGEKLMQEGMWFKRIAHNVKPKVTTRTEIRTLLKSVGLNQFRFADSKYWYINVNAMLDIIKHDFTDRKKYLSERYDCDDFADTFQSHLREIFGINSVAICKSIEWVNIETGEHIEWHRANILIVEHKGKLKSFLFEPQDDTSVLLEKGKDVIHWGKKWKLNLIEF